MHLNSLHTTPVIETTYFDQVNQLETLYILLVYKRMRMPEAP